mmetsp:Transcript_38698/g.91685  ORF Transcript_38698/g.91685 Transcript_38698/m.91685 type:complete len:275 (-) Transcript_38698:986-1810(-)
MSSNLVGDDALLHVIPVREPEVLLGRHIAEKRGACSPDGGGPDGRGDVVVSRRNVGGEGAEGVEGRLVAPVELLVHILLDLVQRDVARALVHDLDVLLPRPPRELPLDLELKELRGVVGVADAPGAEAVPDRERDVILGADVQDLVPVLIGEILFVLQERKLGVDGAAAADNPGEAARRQVDGRQQHPGVDRPVVDALLRLLQQRLPEELPGDVLDDTPRLLEALVDGHSPHGDGRVAHDPLAGLVDVVAGRQVHDGVRAPHRRPLELLHLLLD